MTKVKICGINSALAFDTALEAGADWIGFVFFPPSPRFVTPATAAALSARSRGGPPRVGLFVEPTDDEIAAALKMVPLDVLQIYGRVADLAAIRDRFRRPVWRAAGVAVADDLPVGTQAADALVIEPKPPPHATRPGGNATTFDWTLLDSWVSPTPWLLAGGLTPDTVAEAIRRTGAQAVDVSSGVERVKGEKDPALIRAFLTAAKEAR